MKYLVILSMILSGCAQAHLTPNVQEKLGRPLNPDTEVDIKIEVVGPVDIYRKCNKLNPILWLLSTPILGGMLFGCSSRKCANERHWKTDKPCTCEGFLAFDWDYARNHEYKHCIGYGEF